MAGMSDYLEAKLLAWLVGTSMGTSPSFYVALFNGDPTDTGNGGVEVTTIIRSAGRVTTTMASYTANSIANSAAVDFGAAAADATITHVAVFDAASGGNMLFAGSLTSGTQSVSTGTNVSFVINALVFSVD